MRPSVRSSLSTIQRDLLWRELGVFRNGSHVQVEPTTDHRAAVDAFIANCHLEASSKITRTHIWKAAGHHTARQFQFWRASSPKATVQDNQNFGRIIAMNPADFVLLLQRKNIKT